MLQILKCVTTCVFKRNNIVSEIKNNMDVNLYYKFTKKMSDNGFLSMENMTKVFLRFQIKDEWKAVITKSISYCFSEMKSTSLITKN